MGSTFNDIKSSSITEMANGTLFSSVLFSSLIPSRSFSATSFNGKRATFYVIAEGSLFRASIKLRSTLLSNATRFMAAGSLFTVGNIKVKI